MFLNYYKLTEQPFGVTPDSRLLYLGPQHREALASLVYGTESNRGFLAMIAEPGMGKTSLLYHYLSYMRDKARTAFVFRTDCDSGDLLRYILLDLGIDISGMDLPKMHDTLNRVLTEEMLAGRRFVLVIDEAQNLEEKTLESIRLLSNFETPWMKLMLIVLAGQPQLANHLASPSLVQLRQRISMVIRIEPLSFAEVNAYIDHRLWIAGGKNPSLFTPGARKLISEHSRGIPRNINNICFNAMSLGCALKQDAVDHGIIRQVIADLDLAPLMEKNIVTVKSEEEPKQKTPILSDTAKRKSIFRDWIPRLAIASMLLLAGADPTGQVKRAEPEAGETPASPVATVSAPLIPIMSTYSESPSIEQAHDSVRVIAGQTLYHISVDKFGKYNDEVVEKLRGLNPWLRDPNHIESGQDLRISSETITTGDVQRADEQASRAPSAGAERQ